MCNETKLTELSLYEFPMQTINIHKAKTHLSSLIDGVVRNGEPFIIAKSGKPMVKVVPLDSKTEREKCRLGFLAGQGEVPSDFDSMGQSEIEADFYST